MVSFHKSQAEKESICIPEWWMEWVSLSEAGLLCSYFQRSESPKQNYWATYQRCPPLSQTSGTWLPLASFFRLVMTHLPGSLQPGNSPSNGHGSPSCISLKITSDLVMQHPTETGGCSSPASHPSTWSSAHRSVVAMLANLRYSFSVVPGRALKPGKAYSFWSGESLKLWFLLSWVLLTLLKLWWVSGQRLAEKRFLVRFLFLTPSFWPQFRCFVPAEPA